MWRDERMISRVELQGCATELLGCARAVDDDDGPREERGGASVSFEEDGAREDRGGANDREDEGGARLGEGPTTVRLEELDGARLLLLS